MAITIDAGDLVMAMTSGDMRWYLNTVTGEISPDLSELDFMDDEVERSRPEPEAARIRVDTLDSHTGYRIMERFTAAMGDDEVREALTHALRGKGAFRRFRDAVGRWPDILARWRDFHFDAVLEEAKEWLESEDIEADIVIPPPARPEPPAPPKPGKAKKPVRVGLADMLLLGAPEGKTELLEGRVYRVFVAATPAAARVVFADIARDMHESAGLGWRRAYIEGKDRVSVGRYELDIQDNVVELAVKLEPGLWARFSEA